MASTIQSFNIDKQQINTLNKYVHGVSNNTSNFIYDDFDDVDQLISARITPSGHNWSISGPGAGAIGIVGGLVPAGDNFYASIQNGNAIKYIGGTFSFIPYIGTDETSSPQAVLIAQNSDLTLGTMLHFQLRWDGWSIQKRIAGGAFIGIGAGGYILETNGTIYRAAMRISGNTVILELPDGTTTSITDSDISTLSLTAGTWQLQQMYPVSALKPRWHSIL